MFIQHATRATFRPMAPCVTGLTADTLVETASGWRGAGDINRGTAVQTFDGGLRAVAGIDRRWLAAGDAAPLIHVPGGAFDACGNVVLTADQALLIDTQGDPDLPDAAWVLVPALALVGFRGVRARPVTAPVEVVTLLFAEAEAVWAQSGLLVYCPAMADGPGRVPDDAAFPRLGLTEARDFLRRLCGFHDHADALRHAA